MDERLKIAILSGCGGVSGSFLTLQAYPRMGWVGFFAVLVIISIVTASLFNYKESLKILKQSLQLQKTKLFQDSLIGILYGFLSTCILFSSLIFFLYFSAHDELMTGKEEMYSKLIFIFFTTFLITLGLPFILQTPFKITNEDTYRSASKRILIDVAKKMNIVSLLFIWTVLALVMIYSFFQLLFFMTSFFLKEIFSEPLILIALSTASGITAGFFCKIPMIGGVVGFIVGGLCAIAYQKIQKAKHQVEKNQGWDLGL